MSWRIGAVSVLLLAPFAAAASITSGLADVAFSGCDPPNNGTMSGQMDLSVAGPTSSGDFAMSISGQPVRASTTYCVLPPGGSFSQSLGLIVPYPYEQLSSNPAVVAVVNGMSYDCGIRPAPCNGEVELALWGALPKADGLAFGDVVSTTSWFTASTYFLVRDAPAHEIYIADLRGAGFATAQLRLGEVRLPNGVLQDSFFVEKVHFEFVANPSVFVPEPATPGLVTLGVAVCAGAQRLVRRRHF